MTTNAGPEYFVAVQKYQEAKTPEDRLRYLKEMFRYAPKHKSSENLVAEITWKISRLKKEIEKEKEQAKKRIGGRSLNVKKEGGGQIAIIGMPNSGKSTFLWRLTGVNVEIAPYPFTTTKPEVGMMNYKGAHVQLVEVPALIEGSSHGKANGTQLLSLARNADALIVIHRNEEEKGVIVKELKNAGIVVDRKRPKVFINNTKFKGITIAGKRFLKISEKEFGDTLKKLGVLNASILLEEPTDLNTLIEALDDALDYKNCLFVKTSEWKDNEDFRREIFSLLDKIIVYTKKPGHEPDYEQPLVLRKGATINNVAETVHKDIARNLKYARVWGSAKFPGQRVAREYVLHSGDVVEISA